VLFGPLDFFTVGDLFHEVILFLLFQAKGRLVKTGSFTHSYPFCWRSDTPLIYRAVPSWYASFSYEFELRS